MMRTALGPGLCALVLLLTNPARADIQKIPSPQNSTVPCAINLVGCTNGAADPAGDFTVTVRDLANTPRASVIVVIDFSSVCDDVRLASVQLAPGMVLDAPTHTMRAFTDATGSVTFCIMGAARGMSSGGSGAGVNIYADGVLLTDGYNHPPVTVGAYDLDGAVAAAAAGVGPSDLSVWMSDAFAGYRARSDYDREDAGCTGALGPADLSRWLQVLFAAHSATNGTMAGCP